MDLKQFELFFRQVCAFDQLMGLKFTLHEPGKIDYRLLIQKQHLSSPKICHGGVLAAMMDAVLGLTTLTYAITLGNFCSTVEYKLNFLKEVKEGDALLGQATLEYKGNRLVSTMGTIIHEQTQEKIAIGLGTFNLYPYEKKDFVKTLLNQE